MDNSSTGAPQGHQQEQEEETAGLLAGGGTIQAETTAWKETVVDEETAENGSTEEREEEQEPEEDSSLRTLYNLYKSSPEVIKQEFRTWWSLAWPLGITIGARLSLVLTDVAVLGHLGTDYLSASSLANIWILVTSQFMALSLRSAVNTLSSQAVGAGNEWLANCWILIALMVVTILSVFVALAWGFGAPILFILGPDNARVVELAVTFCRWNILSVWPTLAYPVISAWLMSHNCVFPLLVVSLCMVVFNLLANIILVHGMGGFPGLGFVGSPLATALTRWIALVSVGFYVHYKGMFARAWPGLNPSNFCTKSRLYEFLVKQVLPLSAGIMVEEFQLQTVALLSAKLGSVALATHMSMFDLYFFLTSTLYGLINATRTRVGHHIGRSSIKMAKIVGIIDLVASLIMGLVNGCLIIGLHDYIGYIFSKDPAVLKRMSQISNALGPAYLMISIFYVTMSILTGMGRPRPVAVAFLIGAWVVSVPLGYICGFVAELGILGLWIGMTIGYSVVCTIASSYLLFYVDWHGAVIDAKARNAQNVAPE